MRLNIHNFSKCRENLYEVNRKTFQVVILINDEQVGKVSHTKLKRKHLF